MLADVVTSLAAYDARLPRELFTEQLRMLNGRFGRPTEPAHADALFDAAAVGGYVDLRDFLSTHSAVHYFLFDRQPAHAANLSA